MQIDASTVLLSGIFVKLLLATLFLLFWLADRRSSWFGWWSGSYFFAALAATLFLLRGFAGELSAVGAGVAALIATFGFCWQAARAFHGRDPFWLPLEIAWSRPAWCRAFSRTFIIASSPRRSCLRHSARCLASSSGVGGKSACCRAGR